MSCSHYITSYTNSKYLYNGVNRWRNQFSCGRCDSCNSKNRAEWRLRTYYEAQRCLNAGGYILFDTLTYCDDYIRKYSDIFSDLEIPPELDKYAFSRRDVQLFFKRLRTNLKRAGYPTHCGNLKYILSSEYGTSEKTRGFINTHRPHYHFLLFVDFDIDPVLLSRLVAQSWSLGKTDGVKPYDDCSNCFLKKYCRGRCLYQSSSYVLNERVISRNNQANCMKCVNYVSKYISKDLYTFDMLSRRVDDLFNVIMPDYRDDYSSLKFYRRFKSQVMPFHLQSQQFGVYALQACDQELLHNYNKISFLSGDKNVYTTINLPRYLERKLYYDCVKIDGRIHWVLNQSGVDAKLRLLDYRINQFVSDYRVFDKSISVDRLFDLALYACVYRGTICDPADLLLPYKEYYKRLIVSKLDQQPLLYNYNTEKDKYSLGRFLASGYYVDDAGEIHYKNKILHSEFKSNSLVVVNDKTCAFWLGFDKRLALYDHWKQSSSRVSDVIQYGNEALLDRYKQYGLFKIF